MGAKQKFRRLQELFEVGEVIVVEKDGEEIPMWVAKISSFEREEATRDGRAQRARQMLAWDRDEDQQMAMRVLLDDSTNEDLVQTLMYDKDLEHMRLAGNEVRTDKTWKERLEALDRIDLDGLTDEQAQTMVQVADEFNAAVAAVRARLAKDLHDELAELDREELEKRYTAAFRQMIGAQSFREAMRQSELFFALRDCSATRVDGDWDHSRCAAHQERLLETRSEVLGLPEPVIAKAADILNRQMTEEEAGNSGAPSVSSEPSGQRAVQEASALSSRTGM